MLLAATPSCPLHAPCAGLSSAPAAGAPWTDQPVMEWLNSVLLELYRTGRLQQAGQKGRNLRQHEAATPVAQCKAG